MQMTLLTALAITAVIASCGKTDRDKVAGGETTVAMDTVRHPNASRAGPAVPDTVILWSGTAAVRNTLITHLDDRCYRIPKPPDCPQAMMVMDTVRKP
jgi:hypothetical protein